MNKITLQDIMESLNSDDMESARASLHEWFVGQSKQIHANLTGQVVESEEVDEEETEEVNEAEEVDEEDEALEEAAESDDEDADCVEESVEEDDEAEEVSESEEDLIAELAESFAGLETCSDKLQNVEGAQVGEEGKVPVNTKSTLPNHKAKDRQGGEAVEIKNDQHNGFALEKAPKAKDAPVKHHVQNSKDDPKKVAAPKGALLNKMDGSVNTQSPISGKGAKGLKK